MTERLVRTLEFPELDQLIGWAAAEGWNPGLNDAVAFWATDPEGFIGAFVDGEMVAGISAVAYGARYGFIGLFISREDRRGQGHGKAVWEAGMARLAGRTVGLDGVDAQYENYRRKGFAPAYRTIRFGGRPLAEWHPRPDIGEVTRDHLPGVLAFDRRSFPEAREAFLARWLAPPHHVQVASRDGAVTGYGVMRRCGVGWKIGGLTAVDDATASALFFSLASRADGEVYIDVPAMRQRFIEGLLEAGFQPGFETTRMYLGTPLPLAAEVYGITTLELG